MMKLCKLFVYYCSEIKFLQNLLGVAGLAAILFADIGLPSGSKVATIISGGNIEPSLLKK